jgi:SPP1 family predicted phage head-tail adaptor
MPAGKRGRWRVTFSKRAAGDDGHGNITGDFVDQFTVSAELRPKLGGETVLAGRLEGRQLVNIIVLQSAATRAITTDWRARDAISGAIYNIRSGPIDPKGNRQEFELLAETDPDLQAVIVPAPYAASAVAFAGATLLKNAAPVGVATGKFSVSAWIRSRYDGANNRAILSTFQANGTDTGAQGIGGSTFYIDHDPGGPLFLNALEPTSDPAHPEWGTWGAGASFYKAGVGDGLGQLWHHLLCSVDYSQLPVRHQVYIDDVEVAMLLNFDDGQPIPMALDLFQRTFFMPDWKVPSGTQPPVQDMADVWISAEAPDLSVEANRRKFIGADLKPVSLGVNGELPTGNAPAVFFSGDKDAFPINRGTMGAFELVGPLTDADSSPSD